MEKTKQLLATVFLMAILIYSCSSGGDDGPPPNSAPGEVSGVVFPTSNLLCTDNTITFQWNASTDPDGDAVSYRIIIATDRELINQVENRIVSTNSVTLTLEEGVAYYWSVTAIDDEGLESNASATLAFFTSGPGITNYAPFTTELVSPEDEGTVASGTVTLSWIGADTDIGDTLTYDLYFGEDMDPPLIQSALTTQNSDVTTTVGTTYYWRVDTIDDSNVKTIGQLWSFTTN